MFAASIYDNIALGRPEASAEEVEAAARAANAHNFILALPEGYQTQVRRMRTVAAGRGYTEAARVAGLSIYGGYRMR